MSDPGKALAAGYDTTLLPTEAIRPGKTYWVAHGIQLANGQVLEIAKRVPKTFDDPAYCTRLIHTLAAQQGIPDADYGKPVVLALVRVVQEGEDETMDANLPAAAPKAKGQPIYVVRRPAGKGFNWAIEYGDHRSHAERGRELEGTKRVELPEGWIGTLDQARAVFEAGNANG